MVSVMISVTVTVVEEFERNYLLILFLIAVDDDVADVDVALWFLGSRFDHRCLCLCYYCHLVLLWLECWHSHCWHWHWHWCDGEMKQELFQCLIVINVNEIDLWSKIKRHAKSLFSNKITTVPPNESEGSIMENIYIDDDPPCGDSLNITIDDAWKKSNL